MNKTTFLYGMILMFGVLIGAISQVMLKISALKTYPSRLKEYLNPLVISAYVLFVGTTLLSVFAYKGIPLSMGPILEATSYLNTYLERKKGSGIEPYHFRDCGLCGIWIGKFDDA